MFKSACMHVCHCFSEKPTCLSFFCFQKQLNSRQNEVQRDHKSFRNKDTVFIVAAPKAETKPSAHEHPSSHAAVDTMCVCVERIGTLPLCLQPPLPSHSLFFTLPPSFNPAYSACAWRVNELTCAFIKFEQLLFRLFPEIDFRWIWRSAEQLFYLLRNMTVLVFANAAEVREGGKRDRILEDLRHMAY